jgi:Zn-dependent peptidase ImmA (M78 family)
LAGKDTNIGAKRARETRAALPLAAGAPIPCLLRMLEEQLRVPVVIAALPADIAGCCWREGERVVLWVNGRHAVVRQRFTLAHELGHVRCGHDQHVAVDTFETLSGTTTDSREIQANAFAAELLAPAHGVVSMVAGEPILDDVVLVAARFGISAIAALYRLNSLRLTVRYETLKREIDEGLHAAVAERLSPEPLRDLMAGIDSATLPRLSPLLSGSALAALVAGAASIGDAAGAAGCDSQQLASAAATIGA